MSGTDATNPEIQQDISVDNLSKKVEDATNELNQLKNWLNVYSIEEQDRRLTEIEDSILDCTQDLQQLETETLSNSDKQELNKLKTKINTLKSSKEQLWRPSSQVLIALTVAPIASPNCCLVSPT